MVSTRHLLRTLMCPWIVIFLTLDDKLPAKVSITQVLNVNNCQCIQSQACVVCVETPSRSIDSLC